MFHQQSQQQKDIQRSLDRLTITFKEKKTLLILPAFYYSANLLNNYAKQLGSDAVNPHFFQTFKYLVEEFGKQDLASIVSHQKIQSKNHQEIMHEILQIVDSSLFIQCLRPDIKSHRRSAYHLAENGQILTARSNYNFNLSIEEIRSANQIRPQNSPSKSVASVESQDFLINQYDEIWQSMERAYRQHNIDEAYQKSREYIDKIRLKTEIPNNRQQLLDRISKEYTEMTEFYQEFDKGEWQFDKEENGITLEYKEYKSEKMVAIRILGEFDIPLEPFLSILSEIDLMGDYVPFCYDCKELKVISRNQRIGTSKIYIPLLTDRETYFYAVGYDRQKVTGGIFMYSKAINEDWDFQKRHNYSVPKQSEFVRFEYKFFIVEYLPISKQRAKIRLSSKIDMKMNFLPLFILNKSARIFAFDYFKNVIKIAKNYKGSPWQKKVNERPELYDFFKKKVQEMYGQMYG